GSGFQLRLVHVVRVDLDDLEALHDVKVHESIVKRPDPHGRLPLGRRARARGRRPQMILVTTYDPVCRACRRQRTGTTTRLPPGTVRVRPRPTADASGTRGTPAGRCPSSVWAGGHRARGRRATPRQGGTSRPCWLLARGCCRRSWGGRGGSSGVGAKRLGRS